MSGKDNTTIYHCAYHETTDPASLVPHPRNPNQHPKKQMEALCASIRRYGWRHVVTVSNLSGRVVSGHARRLAGIALGCDVPVVRQDFRDEAEELAYVIADNRIAELSVIDTGTLATGLEWLATHGADLVSVGFDDYVPPSFDGDEFSLSVDEPAHPPPPESPPPVFSPPIVKDVPLPPPSQENGAEEEHEVSRDDKLILSILVCACDLEAVKKALDDSGVAWERV